MNEIDNKNTDCQIMVSVLCSAYNHENYISKALDSILMQKTDFSFEIIIHDDASTDNTAKIIKDYENKYPEIIKPIYQKTNLYRQGIDRIKNYMLPKAKGKYLAFCECDDYWKDENKLQLQVEAMEKNPGCSMCVHYTEWTFVNDESVIKLIPERKDVKTSGILSKNDTYNLFFHLTSRLVRKKYYEEYINDKPDYAQEMMIGDVPQQMFFRTKGDFYFIDKVMSVYNKGTEGSFTERVEGNSEINRIHVQKYLNGLYLYEKHVDENEREMIHKDYELKKLVFFMNENDFKNILNDECKKFIGFLSFKARIKCILGCYFPFIFNIYLKIKRIIVEKN